MAIVEELGLAMQAILKAELMVTVTFDLFEANLSKLQLPAVVSPTISKTLDSKWIAGQVLIQRQELGHVLRQLDLAGACGVFVQDVQAYMHGGETKLRKNLQGYGYH